MKTVTGRVVASHPVALSKAASILSKFASSEIGVSQAVSAYLRRASTAFNELKSLHKELKRSSSKEKEPRSDVTQERYLTRVGKDSSQSEEVRRVKRHEEREGGGAVHPVGNGAEIVRWESGTVKEEKVSHDRRQVSQGPGPEEESERKEGEKKKKKKKNKKIKEEDGIAGERKVTEEPKAGDKYVKVETGDEDRKKNEERESVEAVHLVDNGAEIVGRVNGTVKQEKLNHDRRQVSQGPSQEEESERKEGKKKKKKNKKIREEDGNGDDTKVTEEPKAGDKSVKAETEEEQRDEERKDKKKDKKRKNDGETGSDEKRSKKKRKSGGD